MSIPDLPDQVLAALAAVQRLITKMDEQGVIIGGVAANLLGAPRFTTDVDAVVLSSGEDLDVLLAVAAAEGLAPRIADAAAFARRSRVLLLHHGAADANVDVSLGVLPFEVEMVENSSLHQVGELMLRLPTPEDLVIMKAVAHRARDYADIEGIMTRHPNLDWRRIEHWVRQFAEALEMPELWSDLARLRDQRQTISREGAKTRR
jgi:hypothetical protein